MNTPTLDQMKRGLAIAEKIAALEAEMASIFGRQTNAPSVAKVSAPGRGGKRRLSPQALANIRAAQKKRWAQFRAGVAKSSSKAATPKKRGGLTAEGRKKLALAMKRRWAAAKAGKAPAPTAPKG